MKKKNYSNISTKFSYNVSRAKLPPFHTGNCSITCSVIEMDKIHLTVYRELAKKDF